MAFHAQTHDLNLLPPADLAGEVERLHDGIRLEQERNLRTLADFKNYRRRIERDGNKLAEEGKREIILPLLDIVDDMENAIKSAPDEEHPIVKGVQIIHKKLLALLEANGVTPFESAGAPFNHDIHEAVALASHEDVDAGIIVDQLRRGYLWHNELLRAAQVRVAE